MHRKTIGWVGLTLSILLLLVLFLRPEQTAEPPPAEIRPPQQKELHFVSTVYPPFACDPKLEDGKEGFMVDILRRIFEHEGYRITITLMPYARATRMAQAGEFDGLVVAVKGFSPDLLYPKEVTGPHPNGFYVKKGNPWRYAGIESLRDQKLAVVQSYIYCDPKVNAYIHSRDSAAKVEVLPSDNDPTKRNLLKLIHGRVAIYAEGVHAADYAIKKHGLADQVEFAGYMSGQMDNYTAFSPALPEAATYVKLFDKGVQALRKSGELQKILSDYGLKDWQSK